MVWVMIYCRLCCLLDCVCSLLVMVCFYGVFPCGLGCALSLRGDSWCFVT